MFLFQDVDTELQMLADTDKAAIANWFFKTGPGEYGEGDIFIGVRIPDIRAIVKQVYTHIDYIETTKLITHEIHEYRMCGLLILTEKAARARGSDLKDIAMLYISLTDYINNWDLVDASCYKILGRYLVEFPDERDILYNLAASHSLWEQRIAIVTTWWFIRLGDFTDTFAISELLLKHPHDLIHKAVGWMLREVGKRDQASEKAFLLRYYKEMPRTMLRYAIEHFDEDSRKKYLTGKL